MKNSFRLFVFKTQTWPICSFLYRSIYFISLYLLPKFTSLCIGISPVQSIYLRRGSAGVFFAPGASDLDLHIFLKEMDSFSEWNWVSKFWKFYRIWRKIFPFFGEVILQTQSEWRMSWDLGAVRAREFSEWRLVYGEKISPSSPVDMLAALDVFTEQWKAWQSILHLFSVARQKNLTSIQSREFAKNAVDFFRLEKSRTQIFPLSREAFLNESQILPGGNLFWQKLIKGEHSNLTLELQLSVCEIIWNYMQKIITYLPKNSAQEISAQDFPPTPSKTGEDKAKEIVAEMMAERWCRRHKEVQAVLFQGGGENFFVFIQGEGNFKKILLDLGALATSFESFGRCLLLPSNLMQNLNCLNIGDQPFRFFDWHKECSLQNDGLLRYRRVKNFDLPAELKKMSLAYLLYVFRQPPKPFSFWSDQIVNVLLRSRLGERGITASTDEIWQEYKKVFPARGRHLSQAFSVNSELEIWAGAYPWLLMEIKTLMDEEVAYAQDLLRP